MINLHNSHIQRQQEGHRGIYIPYQIEHSHKTIQRTIKRSRIMQNEEGNHVQIIQESIIKIQEHSFVEGRSNADYERGDIKEISNHIIEKQIQIIQEDSRIGVETDDPLFYGVNVPQPCKPTPQMHPPLIFNQRNPNQRQFSHLRMCEKVPCGILMGIFLILLFVLGLIIVWIFHISRRHNQIDIIKYTNIPSTLPVIIETKTITPIKPILPVVEKTQKVLNKPKVVPIEEVVVKQKTVPAQIVKEDIVVKPPNIIDYLNDIKADLAILKKQKLTDDAFCQKGSFSFNNKCYICPQGQEWNKSNCILIKSKPKHLKRIL